MKMDILNALINHKRLASSIAGALAAAGAAALLSKLGTNVPALNAPEAKEFDEEFDEETEDEESEEEEES